MRCRIVKTKAVCAAFSCQPHRGVLNRANSTIENIAFQDSLFCETEISVSCLVFTKAFPSPFNISRSGVTEMNTICVVHFL